MALRKGSLPLKCLNHVSLVCKDLDKSVAFYRDLLGFEEIRRPRSLDFDGSWLFGCGMGIHLIHGDQSSQLVERPSAINPKADHLSFQSDHLEEVVALLEAFGIEYEMQRVQEGAIVVSQVFLHDPDHNMIEICNCDCLPVVPLGASRWLEQGPGCAAGPAGCAATVSATDRFCMDARNGFAADMGE